MNAKSRIGLTALHLAAMKGFTKLCIFLIQEHGAAVDALTLVTFISRFFMSYIRCKYSLIYMNCHGFTTFQFARFTISHIKVRNKMLVNFFVSFVLEKTNSSPLSC